MSRNLRDVAFSVVSIFAQISKVIVCFVSDALLTSLIQNTSQFQVPNVEKRRIKKVEDELFWKESEIQIIRFEIRCLVGFEGVLLSQVPTR
jgi:hypothetical protein